MMTGTVTADREAVLRLALRGPGDQEVGCEAVVDTGFDGWLSLPPEIVSALGLRWQRFGRAMLADGSECVFDIYRATVMWDGEEQSIPIYEMDADPLLGMSLMYGYELVLPVVDGATFTLRRVAQPQ